MGNTVTVGQESGKPIELFYKDWGMGRPVA
jgi:hypothetical protein